MGQVETRPEYAAPYYSSSASPKHTAHPYPSNYQPPSSSSSSSGSTPPSASTTSTTSTTSSATSSSKNGNNNNNNSNNSPKKDSVNADTSSNTILGTLDALNNNNINININHHPEFNMDVVVTPSFDPPPPPEKTRSSPNFLTRGRSGSKSNGSTSPKKMSKNGFKPIPPLSISEQQNMPTETQDDSALPRPTTPKNIPRGNSPRGTPRGNSPSGVFGSLVKAFSVGNIASTAKSPRDVKMSKSVESPSILDGEVFFTSENSDKLETRPPNKRGKHVTFALDTNDLETHVQEEQGVEFPKISVIPWHKLRDKGVMSEGPHFTLTKVLLYGNVYVQKSINCPEDQAPPMKTVQKLHKEVEILTIMHHHINIVDFVGITISPTNQVSFLTKHCPFSLQGVLDRNMAFDFKGVAYGVLKGIQHVHSCGFVLGDLKPDKIWLDRNETPKLVDFGNALSIKDAIEASKIVGTIGYMAPEIFLKNGIQDPQALDIFSYGAVLHYMVTKIDPAFKVPTAPGKNITEIARENANTPFDLSKVAEPALRVLLTACLRPNPAERPSTRRALELLSFVKYKWHPDPTAETRRKHHFEEEEDEEDSKPAKEVPNEVQTDDSESEYEFDEYYETSEEAAAAAENKDKKEEEKKEGGNKAASEDDKKEGGSGAKEEEKKEEKKEGDKQVPAVVANVGDNKAASDGGEKKGGDKNG